MHQILYQRYTHQLQHESIVDLTDFYHAAHHQQKSIQLDEHLQVYTHKRHFHLPAKNLKFLNYLYP